MIYWPFTFEQGVDFAFRIAVWSQSRVLIVLLVLVIMGHWSLLLHGKLQRIYAPHPESLTELIGELVGILLKAEWVPGTGCVIVNTDNTMLAATFIYSMCFDLTVLVLTAWKLVLPTKRAERSRLVNLIFGDGLIFFFIAFLANLIATVSGPPSGSCSVIDKVQIFMLLNLNAVMSIIANVPAAIASTVCLPHIDARFMQLTPFLQIVACRAVRRLTNYTSQGAEVFK